ncbi:MAG: hypothetical protein J5584_03390 [Clostridia bacterium]|nr:hypothetical protein [Clostridia bacterium]
MKHLTKRFLLVIMAICLIASALLSGCVPVDTLTDDLNIEESSNSYPVSEEELLEAAGIAGKVYWIEDSNVCHLYMDCGSLNHAAELFEGSAQAAIENGKTRMCKSCKERAEKAAEQELLEAAGLGNHVYWTESDTVYHAYDDCGKLNHSVTLYEGTTQAAIENGKTDLCKFCESRAEKEAAEWQTD